MGISRPGPRAVWLFRASRWAWLHHMRPLALILYNINFTLHGCDLSYQADIGPGFYMHHPVGIVMGGVQAGRNLTLGPNCLLGNRDQHTRDGRVEPLLGDNVTINAGAAVLGPVILGDHVVVGVNAVVVKDCAPGSVMIGIPARPMRKAAEADEP